MPSACAGISAAVALACCDEHLVPTQALQPGHRAAGAAGHLLCLPRQPPLVADLQRSQRAAEDRHAVLPGLTALTRQLWRPIAQLSMGTDHESLTAANNGGACDCCRRW